MRYCGVITERIDKMLGVWNGVLLCQAVCECITDLYPGDAWSYDEAITVSIAPVVQNIRHQLHGYTRVSISIK